MDVSLDTRVATWLSDTTLLLASRLGQSITVALQVEARTVRALDAKNAALLPITPHCSCLVMAPSPLKSHPATGLLTSGGGGGGDLGARLGLVFLGSCSGDSLLLRFSLMFEDDKPSPTEEKAEQATAEPEAKRAKTEEEAAAAPSGQEQPGTALEEGDDDLDIYRVGAATTTSGTGGKRRRVLRVRLKIVDSLLGLGGLHDLCLGEVPGNPFNQMRLSRDRVGFGPHAQHMLACVGGPRQGALLVARAGLVPDPLSTDITISDVYSMWSLRPRGQQVDGEAMEMDQEDPLDRQLAADRDSMLVLAVARPGAEGAPATYMLRVLDCRAGLKDITKASGFILVRLDARLFACTSLVRVDSSYSRALPPSAGRAGSCSGRSCWRHNAGPGD